MMSMRERLLLASACFIAMAALTLFVIGGSWPFRALGFDADTALIMHIGVWLLIWSFGMTYLPGASRWFRKDAA